MRLALTVLDATGETRADVLVSMEEVATVRELARALEDALAPRRDGGLHAVGSQPVDGDGERLAIVIRHPRFTERPDRADPPAGWDPLGSERASRPRNGGATLWVDGGPLAAEVAASRVLRDGMVVSLSPRYAPATAFAEPNGVAEIRIAGGPAAGSVHRLGLGRFEIGSDARCAVVLPDPSVPPRAATLSIAPGGVSVEPAHGAAVALEGETVASPAAWAYGGMLAVGDSLLSLQLPEEADASLSPSDDGGLAYNRPPRLLPPRRPRRLVVPAEPVKGEGPRLAVLTMVLPALFGIGMAVVLHNPLYLGMALLGPLTMGANVWTERRGGKQRHGAAMREYQEASGRYEDELERMRAADEVERRDAAPDPATLLLVATGPRRRLWERRADDHDVLQLRVGTTDLPANIELAPDRGGDPNQDPPLPPVARNVPVPLDLKALGVLGIAGDRGASRALARWLVAQAAILHSPRDLQVVVLAPGLDRPDDWEWVRWLPHARPRDGQDCVALLGTDAETITRRVTELVEEITARRAARSPLELQPGGSAANLLLVLDGARALRRVPGMPRILSEGPLAGVHAICVDDDERLLPEECRTVATWQWEEPARLRLRGGGLDPLGTVLGDQVSVAWCERVARAMAPIRDSSRDDAASMLPDSARLLDLLAMPDPSPDQIERVWARGGRTTEAVLGYASDGPFELDLRRDGPHALVAGTTGAGKSELLQTLIASLAAANRPDAMTFVLIDYKGGSAFKDCARLPHTVGMVSDLDGHLTQRALASLSAELKRREEILLHAGAKDIEDYWDERRRRPDLEPLPRLVLIIDEFASLVAELPEFVTGLVGIAQRGRSLGVHLVLATQRPAGVVSADIRANTNLRIALRVTDATESSDVIEAPDAAGIAKSTPGRCYVRSGASSLTAVQAARVGGRRPGASTFSSEPVVARVGWSDLGRPLPRGADAPGEDDGASTDLSVLVAAIRQAAQRLGLDEQRSPWLAPLDEVVSVDELPRVDAAGRAGGEVAPVAIGLVDVPAEQRRRALALDLAGGGHMLVAGSPRAGRSSVLRTIAGAIADATSPEDVHLYGVDCGANALLPLVSLPHCGAIVGRDQPDRVDRLLTRLTAEVSRRQQLLAEQGASSLAEQRAGAAPGERLPWMVLLLDRWEGFTAAFESYDLGRLIETMLRLLREGPAVGLRAVVASDASGFVGQISTVFEERLILRFADPDDWGRAGIPARQVPKTMPPGRALLPTAVGMLEAQAALLDPDPSGPAQVAALQSIGRAAGERSGALPRARRPMRVDALPARITVPEALRLDPEPAPPAPLWAMIGAGGDALGPIGVDLLQTSPGFVIAGPPRSGRSTALETMTRSLVGRGVQVALITPRRSPLRALADLPGVLGVLGVEGEDVDELDKLLDGLERHVVLVDDAELLADTRMADRLEALVRSARDADQAVVVAGTTEDLGSQYRGFVVDVRRSRSGLLISPRSSNDGDLLGVRLPRNMAAGPPGRGLLALNGTITAVQVALPEG